MNDVFYLKPLLVALLRAGLIERGQGAVYGHYDLSPELFPVTFEQFPPR